MVRLATYLLQALDLVGYLVSYTLSTYVYKHHVKFIVETRSWC